MRKSINVETVFGTLTKEVLAKGWKARIGDWLSYLSNSAFGSEQWKMYETAIKADIEFANANLELLSENDYNWLLEQEKSPTIEPTKSKRSLSIDSPEFKKALAEAPFVCKIHCDSEEEEDNLPDSPENDPAYTVPKEYSKIMGEFNKLASSFTAASNTVKDAISKSVPENTVISESQKKLWVIQMSKGKQIWYKSNNPNSRVTTSIADAELHFTKNNAKYIAGYVCASNKAIYDLPWPVKVTVKEVLCTESSSRTIELVKPVVEAVEKPVTKAQVRARKPKVKEEWVLYMVDVDKTFRYYQTDSDNINWYVTSKLEAAKKFPSYSSAVKANYKLIKTGISNFNVGESKDFE